MQLCLNDSESWMAAAHIQSHDPLPTWFDDELRRLGSRKSLNLDLFKPSNNFSTHDEDSGQQKTAIQKYLTGWKLHALTFGYASVPFTCFHAPLLKSQQLVLESATFGYRVDSSQYRTDLDHG